MRILLGLLIALSSGCAHIDVTQTYWDPEAKVTITNRARGTFFASKEALKRVDIAVRTKTSSKLLGASGWESSGDPETVRAIGNAIGEAAGAAIRSSMGVPPIPNLH